MSGSLVIGVIPVKSVHQFAFINLEIAQLTIWMKGYNNMDVISHSWGTCLAYDMLNSGGIEMHDWVTMGSPLNHEITKPVWNTGKWINCYSMRDPVEFLDMYPQSLISWSPVMIPRTGVGLVGHPQVDVPVETTSPGTGWSIGEHGAYWKNADVAETLRKKLQ